jgi:hypothetical protein
LPPRTRIDAELAMRAVKKALACKRSGLYELEGGEESE